MTEKFIGISARLPLEMIEDIRNSKYSNRQVIEAGYNQLFYKGNQNEIGMLEAKLNTIDTEIDSKLEEKEKIKEQIQKFKEKEEKRKEEEKKRKRRALDDIFDIFEERRQRRKNGEFIPKYTKKRFQALCKRYQVNDLEMYDNLKPIYKKDVDY